MSRLLAEKMELENRLHLTQQELHDMEDKFQVQLCTCSISTISFFVHAKPFDVTTDFQGYVFYSDSSTVKPLLH